jgi:hypothetical protein
VKNAAQQGRRLAGGLNCHNPYQFGGD